MNAFLEWLNSSWLNDVGTFLLTNPLGILILAAIIVFFIFDSVRKKKKRDQRKAEMENIYNRRVNKEK